MTHRAPHIDRRGSCVCGCPECVSERDGACRCTACNCPVARKDPRYVPPAGGR